MTQRQYKFIHIGAQSKSKTRVAIWHQQKHDQFFFLYFKLASLSKLLKQLFIPFEFSWLQNLQQLTFGVILLQTVKK